MVGEALDRATLERGTVVEFALDPATSSLVAH
jgi:hypothetical protein